MKPLHKAITAGLAITLAVGAVALPERALGDEQGSEAASSAAASAAGSDAAADAPLPTDSPDVAAAGDEAVPAPSGYDKSDFYEESASESFSRSVSPLAAPSSRSGSVQLVSLTEEMRYFCKYESNGAYDRGLSAGDSYNALGYYQFDRRYSLIPFIKFCVSYDPATYGEVFSYVLENASSVQSASIPMYDSSTKKLTPLGQKLNDAWKEAYSQNPSEFSSLQDTYAYQNYYLVAERTLASRGIDISDRADCVKGLCWSATNLFGSGGVRKFFNGAFPDAEAANAMSDREFVTTLCNYIVDHVAEFYPTQTQYHKGWQNRYKKELADCLAYIAEDEAAAGSGDSSGSTGGGSENGSGSGSNEGAGENDGSENGGSADGNGGSGAGDNSGETGNAGSGNDAGSGSGSANGSDGDNSAGGDTGTESGNPDASDGSENGGSGASDAPAGDAADDEGGAGNGGQSGTDGSGQGSVDGNPEEDDASNAPAGNDGEQDETDQGDASTEADDGATPEAEPDSVADGSSSDNDDPSASDGSGASGTDDAAPADSPQAGDREQEPALPVTGDIVSAAAFGMGFLTTTGAGLIACGKHLKRRMRQRDENAGANDDGSTSEDR